jgi:spermidine synthase
VIWREQTHGVGITQALDMEPVAAVQSPFQTIEVFQHAEFGRVLALDGTVQLSAADEFVYHEMAVHLPLCARPREEARVLIVGGGDGGILREALRHPGVSEVVMVEIDRQVVEVSNAHVGIQGDHDDPRATVLFADGIEYMRLCAREGRRFELIVLDATDSTSPSKTLWTASFYDDVAACLAPRGVCVDSDILVPGRPDLRLSRDPCDVSPFDLLRSRRPFAGVECCFTRVPLYPAGYFAFFLYTHDGESCREPGRELRGRYYTPSVHRAAFALPTWWRRRLRDLEMR